MKPIIYITYIFAFLSFSCSLDEEPVGLLAPEGFFKTSSDVEAAIFGAYGQMTSREGFGRDITMQLMLRSDMVDIGNRGTIAPRIQINDFEMDAFNSISLNSWNTFFEVVAAANGAIDGARIIEEEEAVKQALEAEGRFLRAFAYYHLVRMYGAVPYIDNVISSTDQIEGIERTAIEAIYEGVVEDLMYAKEHLPNQHEGGIRNRATAGTASTVLASVYLTLEDYSNAYLEAKYVIDNAASFDYALESNYQDLFDGTKSDNLKESIFTLDFEDLIFDPDNYDFLIPITRIWGPFPLSLSVMVPALSVYEEWNPQDFRRYVSFEDSLDYNGSKVYIADHPDVVIQRPHIAKYVRLPGDHAGNGLVGDYNYFLFRYAEVLLIAAEAINEKDGPTAEAIDYVNQIRSRARNWGGVSTTFPADISSAISQADFRTVIQNERRYEFAFEYKRWYDIKRWELLDEVFGGSSLESSNYNYDLTRDYLFPIPQSEIDITGMSQNPGY